MSVIIRDYQASDAPVFERMNIAWLEKFFVVEPYDAQVLANPKPYILDKGGVIWMAEYNGKAVGCIAVMPHKVAQGQALEITKMAVDEAAQGVGAGKKLMQAAIHHALAQKPAKLFLLTNSDLEVANIIYAKMGFINVPLEPEDNQMYQRCNRRWEYPIAS